MVIFYAKFQAKQRSGVRRITIVARKVDARYIVQTIDGSRVTTKQEDSYSLAIGRIRTILVGLENMEVVE